MKKFGCNICGSMEGKLNIDHSHETGLVRGVLCNPCNIMVGYVERAKQFKVKEYLDGTLERGYVKMESGRTPQRVEEGQEGVIPEAGDSDNVERKEGCCPEAGVPAEIVQSD